MVSKDLTYRLLGQDVSASSTFGKTADAGESAFSRLGKGVDSFGQKVGGELGELISKAGEGLEKFGTTGQTAFQKLAIGGGIAAGLGVALMSFGSGAKASQQQLDAAITATGQSAETFSKQIAAAKSQAEDFGHSGIDAENALAVLTEKTGSATTALAYLTLVENLAAAQHISLVDAANLVARALDGNTRLFKQYGIAVDAGAQSTETITKNLDLLSGKLEGQASAASDTFTGKLEAMRQHATDLAEGFANKVGPSLTFFGTAVGLVSGVVDIFAARSARMATAQAAAAVANEAEAVAAQSSVASNTEAAVAENSLAAAAERLTAAQGAAGATGILGKFLAIAGPSAAVIGGVTVAYKAGSEAAKQHGKAVGIATGALNGMTDDIPYFVTKLAGASGMLTKNVAGSGQLKGSLDSLDGTLNLTATSTLVVGKALDDTSKEFKAGTDTATRYENALKGITDTTTGAADSALAFQDGLVQLTASVKDNGTSLAANTEKGRANMEQMLRSIEQINAMAASQTKQGLSTDIVNGTLADNEAALRKSAIAAGFNAQQVDFMIKKYALVPGSIETKAYLDAQSYLNGLDTIASKLSYLSGLEQSDLGAYQTLLGGFNQFTLGDIKQRASGGMLGHAAAGSLLSGWTEVGEHGSELVGPDGRVYPHGQSQQMKRGGGRSAPTYNIYVNHSSLVTDASSQRAIASAVVEAVRTLNMKLPIANGIVS